MAGEMYPANWPGTEPGSENVQVVKKSLGRKGILEKEGLELGPERREGFEWAQSVWLRGEDMKCLACSFGTGQGCWQIREAGASRRRL